MKLKALILIGTLVLAQTSMAAARKPTEPKAQKVHCNLQIFEPESDTASIFESTMFWLSEGTKNEETLGDYVLEASIQDAYATIVLKDKIGQKLVKSVSHAERVLDFTITVPYEYGELEIMCENALTSKR